MNKNDNYLACVEDTLNISAHQQNCWGLCYVFLGYVVRAR